MALPKARWASSSASCACVLRRALGARDVVPLLAQRDHERDRPAVEDPVAGRRVGAEHATLGHGLGVRRVADLDGQAGGLELLLGRVLHHAEDGRGRGVALPAEPPGAHASARDEQQGEEQEQGTLLGPARPADRGDPGDLAGRRHGAAVERRGAVHHGGRLGRRCHLGRHPGELVDVEGVRRGVLASRARARPAAARGRGSAPRPPGRRRAAPGPRGGPGAAARRRRRAAGRGRARSPGRPARRRTPAGRARSSTAAGRPRARACRPPGSGTRPRAAWCR